MSRPTQVGDLEFQPPFMMKLTVRNALAASAKTADKAAQTAKTLIEFAPAPTHLGPLLERGANGPLSVAPAGEEPSEASVITDGLQAVAEAHHEINELREVATEVRVRGLSKAETGADLEQVSNRLEEAEEKLARVVEAHSHTTNSVHPVQPSPKTRQTTNKKGGAGASTVSRGLAGKRRLR